MHRRCCSPPERLDAATLSRVDTESHRAADRSDASAASSSSDFFLTPLKRRPDTALS